MARGEENRRRGLGPRDHRRGERAHRQICMSMGAGSPERLSWLPAGSTFPAFALSADSNICLYKATSSGLRLHGLDVSSAATGWGTTGGICDTSIGAAPSLAAAARSAEGTVAGISCPVRA